MQIANDINKLNNIEYLLHFAISCYINAFMHGSLLVGYGMSLHYGIAWMYPTISVS